jgi:ribosomal-protein-alanine N-acetyltransferase
MRANAVGTSMPRRELAQVPMGNVMDWRQGLPTTHADRVTIRELKLSDAASLFELLSVEEVRRFISPPPASVEGFERFIGWTRAERAAGRYVCFAVVPRSGRDAVGLIQVRQLDTTFHVAEWGFAVGAAYWGTGLFEDAANAVLDFTFGTMGVERLEARATVTNARGNGALQKIGATREAVLRASFLREGVPVDQCLWSLLACDWRDKAVWGPRRRPKTQRCFATSSEEIQSALPEVRAEYCH